MLLTAWAPGRHRRRAELFVTGLWWRPINSCKSAFLPRATRDTHSPNIRQIVGFSDLWLKDLEAHHIFGRSASAAVCRANHREHNIHQLPKSTINPVAERLALINGTIFPTFHVSSRTRPDDFQPSSQTNSARLSCRSKLTVQLSQPFARLSRHVVAVVN